VRDPLNPRAGARQSVAIVDAETRSALDLKRVGAYRYSQHPSTAPLCLAYAIGDRPVELWTPPDPPPAAIVEAAADPGFVFGAFNAGFERAICAGILTPRHNWPRIEQWVCLQARCLALALPPSLAKVAKILGLANQKSDDGIMHQMSKPRLPRGDEDPNAGPYWFDDAEHREALYAYCKQDVACERDLYRALPPLSEAEQELWVFDQRVNDRGFYTDGGLIKAGIAIVEAAMRAVEAELVEVTGGEIETTHQVTKLIEWLAARGCALGDLQKGTLASVLKEAS
jgi:DNA polymerase